MTQPAKENCESPGNERTRITAEGIERAVAMIDAQFLNTPQVEFESIAKETGVHIVLKIETLNPIRSFKGRGASYFIAGLRDLRALVTASAGNFGQGLAFAGRSKGINVTVFAAKTANPLKIACMRDFGAEVVLVGQDFDEAKSAAREYAVARDTRFVEDGRDAAISEGAGTIAIELLDSQKPFDAILVPVGNGALINGIGSWVKKHAPETSVIGVCASGAPAMARSWRSGKVENAASETIADGVAVRVPIAEAVAHMRNVVDDVLLVEDAAIVQAMRLILHHAGLVTEPAGALGVAGALTHRTRFIGRRIAVPLCGANITPEQFRTWLT